MKKKTTEKGEFNQSTLDNLLEGFQIISYDWRYIYVNDAVVKHSKYPDRESLIGYTMMEKYPGIEHTDMFKKLQDCMQHRVSTQLENEFKFPDGSVGWFELRIKPIPEGLFILSIDITQRKKAEQETVEYLKGLEEMLFMTSHRVRQPVANIIGISNLMEMNILSYEELNKIIGYMKTSAVSLDLFTQELTNLIHRVKVRENSSLKDSSSTSSGLI